jgi:hypothetical protein
MPLNFSLIFLKNSHVFIDTFVKVPFTPPLIPDNNKY